MNKKRFAAVLLSAAICVSITACGGTTDSTASSGSTSSAQVSEEGKEYNLSLIMKVGSAEYFDYLAAGAEAYSEEHPNVTVNISGPTSYTAYDEQLNLIETALSNGSIDGYIISPLQSDTASHLLTGETRPVVAVDTDIEAEEVISFVGTGNTDAAEGGGIAAVEAAREAGWEEITAIALTGGQGDQTHEARVEGYKNGIEEAGGTFLEDETQYCDASADRASAAMEGIIQSHPEGISIIVCTNDDMAMAAARIARDSGNENYQNTIFCGFDGNQAACEAVLEGTLTMTVAQDAYTMGYRSVEAVVDALNGGTTESFIDSGSTVITQDNAQEQLDRLEEISS